MHIEVKNLLFLVSPLILVGVAWGVSTATIKDLQAETEDLREKVEKVQVMEVEGLNTRPRDTIQLRQNIFMSRADLMLVLS